MVVGKKEKTDVKYKRDAILILNRRRYDRTVYGDKETPNRRDLFPPKIDRRLPDKAKVRWMGKWYNAKLSFRYGRGGVKIPVYTWEAN